jgi:hypothetical protein
MRSEKSLHHYFFHVFLLVLQTFFPDIERKGALSRYDMGYLGTSSSQLYIDPITTIRIERLRSEKNNEIWPYEFNDFGTAF